MTKESVPLKLDFSQSALSLCQCKEHVSPDKHRAAHQDIQLRKPEGDVGKQLRHDIRHVEDGNSHAELVAVKVERVAEACDISIAEIDPVQYGKAVSV